MRYIDADALIAKGWRLERHAPSGMVISEMSIADVPTAEVAEVRHGHWELEIKAYRPDTWDERDELCVYILAICPLCGQAHSPKQIFSKTFYPPDDADDDFLFDKASLISEALNEFRKINYKFQNYCPNCGARMDGDDGETV